MPIQLHVLRGRELVGADGRAVDQLLGQPKRFALLAYLLLDRPFRTHTRDELLGMFWADSSEEKARNSLSQALTFVRRALGDDAILTRGIQDVAANRALFECDALAFQDAIRQSSFELALATYQRDLLDGFHVDEARDFEEWLDRERRYLRDSAARVAATLAVGASAAGDNTAALDWSKRRVSLAPHDELAARDLIMLHEKLGQRASALHAYEEFAGRLWSTLHIKPSLELASLVERIRTTGTGHELVAIGGAKALIVADSHPVAPRVMSIERWRLRLTWRAAAAGASAVLLVGAAGAGIARRLDHPASSQAPHATVALALDDSVRIHSESPGVTVALSRDGSRIAYLGGDHTPRLYLRTIDAMTPTPVQGTADALNPAFSPDGKWLAFVSEGDLMKSPIAGGPPVLVATNVNRFGWGDGDVIIFARPNASKKSGLWQISANGGAPRQVTAVDTLAGEKSHTWPWVLPGGKAALFEIHGREVDSSELAVVRLDDGRIFHLGVHGCNPRYLSSGHIVFGRVNGLVFAVPFDVEHFRVTGPVTTIMRNVIVKSGGATEMAVDSSGTLIFVPSALNRHLVVVDRHGTSTPLMGPAGAYAEPRYAPDGKALAVVVGPPEATDVWVYDLAHGSHVQLSHNGRSDQPTWSSDGTHLVWRTLVLTKDSAWHVFVRQRADGTGPIDTLISGAANGVVSPRGDVAAVAYGVVAPQVEASELISLDAAHRRMPLAPGPRTMFRISPDDRWVASRSRGQEVIRIEAAAGFGAVERPIGLQGNEPVWGPSSRELFVRTGGRVLAIALRVAPRLAVARIDTLFPDTYWSRANAHGADYDVAPDGNHFVFVAETSGHPQPVLAFGWLEKLREMPPAVGRKR